MSRLDELIQELCPDGVEYKKIEEVANYEQPSKYIVKSTKYDDSYVTPVLTAGQTFILGYTNETDGIFQASKDNPVIIFDDFTGAFKWVDFPFKVKSSAMKIITIKENNMPLRYLFHIMGNLGFKSDEHKRLWISIYSQLKIPVPPLEVQREIVRILDSFTLLTAKLTAELTARKKQYEYYRDMLLTFDVRGGATSYVAWRTLGEICDVRDGTHDSPKPSLTGKYLITSKNVKNGTIDCTGAYLISDKDYEQINVRSKVDTWDILFTMIGTIGEIGMVAHEPDFAIKNVGLIKTGNELLSRFLRHYLVSDKVKAYIDANRSKGTQAFLALGKLRELPVPVVSEPVMKNLVHVLDNFDAICSDLNIGLPAEIEARQKQYEFYRDKLLSFKQL